MDFFLDPVTWDIVIDESGHVRLVEGAELVAQRMRVRLMAQRRGAHPDDPTVTVDGEHDVDQSLGLDWHGRILVRNPNIAAIRADVAALAASTPGVRAVRRVDVTVDSVARRARIHIEATTDDGAPITVEV